MKKGEFPALKEYETPEREKEMEQKLPKAIGWSINFFLERHLFLLNALQREGSRGRAQQIKGLDRKQAYGRVLEQFKTGHHLEALSIMDISVRYIELDVDALDYIPKEERDTG